MTQDLPPDPPTNSSKLDTAGAIASGLCAIHCALVALAPSLLVAMGLGGAMSHEFEWAFTGAAVLIGLVAGIQGFRSHGSWGLLAGFLTMATALIAVRFLEEWIGEGAVIAGTPLPHLPMVFAVLAGVGMIWMHILNWRRNRPVPEI